MKKHHLIFLSTALFVVLFYEEVPGINLGILGLVFSAVTFLRTAKENRSFRFLALTATSMLSSFAFAWYGDFPSFLALFMSLFLLTFVSQNRDLKSLLVIPVFVLTFLTFVYRIFQFEQWLPTKGQGGWLQRLVFVGIVPALLLAIFFGIYAQGSQHFSDILSALRIEFDFWQVLALTVLGFFISFNFWNYYAAPFIVKNSHWISKNFHEENRKPKPTYAFLPLDVERTGGMVTFAGLNVLLLFFVFTFNYEQFVELAKTPAQLAEETHERVGAVIMSTVMAVLVILFYFKGSFNFDPKAQGLKLSAKIWMVLNAVLVLSAIAKNTEYVMELGLTYKRLGVYAFLMLSLIGVFFTLVKIQRQKTNAYLFHQMAWYFYGTVLVCSFFNWGGILTGYNMARKNFDAPYHHQQVEFNEKQLLEYYKNTRNRKAYEALIQRVNAHKKQTLLSKQLYYECVSLPGFK